MTIETAKQLGKTPKAAVQRHAQWHRKLFEF